MSVIRTLTLTATHLGAIGLGFALGIYALPILTAPEAPSEAQVMAVSKEARFSGTFTRDLQDSDRLHWGEGEVSVSSSAISLMGRLAPGPDYKLYLSPTFVETEADFERIKPSMVRVGDVRTFENFLVPVAQEIDISDYNTVIIWCESFGEFITAAQYQ